MKRLSGWCAIVLLAGAAGAANAQVVISQVYGGGGNSGATLRSDFIELRNTGSAAVDVSGWSVQYASSTGTSWQRTALAGTIAPGGFYLVKQADGAGGTVNLPAPDATGTIPMAGGAGKVALVSNNTSLSGACPLGGAVVDFVGYGGANCSETAPTRALSNTTAALRNGNGATDTNNNAADFSIGAPTPRNSGAEPPEEPEAPLALTIPQVQGTGLASAYVGKRVVVEGIVTARRFNNAFFLQAAAGDGDPATSDALIVFTSSAPPATAAVGNRVRVTGLVGEFTPSGVSTSASVTQILQPTVEVLGTGATLPEAIELTAAQLAPGEAPTVLEAIEAMRVRVAEAIAVSPSDGSLDENDALSFTNGEFYAVLPGVPRPFREPGIDVLDAIGIPAAIDPPRFDNNSERLFVRSRGQVGATPLAVDVGATITGLVGVLDYVNKTWALLPDTATPPTVTGGVQPRAVADAGYEDVTVASFNLLRLFDEVDDGASDSVVLTAAALDKRLTKTAAAVCDWVKAPDILGVVEVENQRVLSLLAERINTTCARSPGYVAYLAEGNDPGGIDVGFLVSTREVAPGTPRVQVLDVTQFGKDATFANPNGTTEELNDRPPLRLRAVVRQDNGASYPITVIANHLRSLIDIDSVSPGANGWATVGARNRAKRGAQAAYLAGLVEQFQQANPAERIVLVGDFNAFQFNDGYVDVMGIIRGDEAPADRVLTYVDSPVTTPLIDGSDLIADPAERYSYSFDGNAQSLDHVVVNEALALDAAMLEVDHARINADFGEIDFGDASKVTRTSDHDPVRLRIAVADFRSADLALALAADQGDVPNGGTATFRATVRNAGPNAAAFAAVAFAFDAAVTPTVDAPAGWTCAAPANDADRTVVTCTVPSLATGAEAAFTLRTPAAAQADGALTLAASVQSQTRDPANGDNGASVDVLVLPAADLAVRIESSPLLTRGAIAAFVVPVTNAGPDAANDATLVIEGTLRVVVAAVSAPDGWRCGRVATTGAGFRAECTRSAPLATGTTRFAFAVVTPGQPARGATYTARIEAATADPDASDNVATLVVPGRR